MSMPISLHWVHQPIPAIQGSRELQSRIEIEDLAGYHLPPIRKRGVPMYSSLEAVTPSKNKFVFGKSGCGLNNTSNV